jgi:hypothetical protein
LNLMHPNKSQRAETEISFKRDNSVKNQWTITKFELDLRIPMTKLHMQFEPYASKQKSESRN